MKDIIEEPTARSNIIANLARWKPELFTDGSVKGSATRFLSRLTQCATLKDWRQGAREFQIKLPAGTVRKDQTAAMVMRRLVKAGVNTVPVEERPKGKRRKQT